ncbi:Permease family protein [Paenibacillus sp. yr247]|nr:Permease family protein [Paenibacillus sp. yr247]
MNTLFKLKERGTSIPTELMAGVMTFLTMVYIVIVNPGILSKAGMDFHGVFIATVLASIVATLIMGLFANYPIVIAPGMLSLTSFRYMLLDAIPSSLKHAITAGIGLFITFIGLQNAKIIVASPATLLTLGNLREPMTSLTIVGLIVSLVLMAY